MASKFEWQTASPESQGMKPDRLGNQWEQLKKRNTKTCLVIRNDKIVFERYAEGWDKNKPHYTASAAKAVVGGLALMLAMDDGLINIDDAVCKYIPQWENDLLKSRITIRQLASHTSGLDDAHEEGVTHEDLHGWKGAFWKQDTDPFLISRDEVPVVFSPGTDYLYSNPGIAMLGYVITASLKGTVYDDIRMLLWERIIKPIGITEDEWSIGYNRTFELEGLKLVPDWGGANITPRAMAKIGRLMLNRGVWEGNRLINTRIIKQALSHSGCPFCYGLTWRVNSDLAGNKCWPSFPWDAFVAWGAGMQLLLVIPSRRLIVVRNGEDLEQTGTQQEWEKAFEKYLFQPLMEAVESEAPCPWSTKITRLDWAPASSILRHADGGINRDGSDNWPVTWADDDNIYTAYGDGYGFSPELPYKLSLGFARIKGTPENFKCENIRSDAEKIGLGEMGEKSSGILMVDGILYLWVRNVDNKGEKSRLLSSKDYAKTWEWCGWIFEEFGQIAFVNYGKNYAGARDNFVYMVCHDHPSAYVEADCFILMRVPKERIMDRSAYEFFTGANDRDEVSWSADVKKREAVFKHPNHCCRASISYNAGIGRYLFWQQYNLEADSQADTRFYGGVGIYEAPEPWGPWSTAYFSEKWDVGPGELGCFPTKWMSDDGKTVHLVFSGNDNFCVRKATLAVS